MMTTEAKFRSSSFEHGMAKKPGCIHFHIDCAENIENSLFLVDVARYFDAKGWLSKITNIATAVSGSHSNEPEFLVDYSVHTPELLAGHNSFSSYLTMIVPENKFESVNELRLTVKQELRKLLVNHQDPRTVYEIERVSYCINAGVVSGADPIKLKLHDNDEKFEIHHFVDLHSRNSIPPQELEPFYSQLTIPIGGWFSLFNNGIHSLRSVKFSNTLDVDVVLAEHAILNEFVKEKYARYQPKVTCVIEQILDVWKNTNHLFV